MTDGHIHIERGAYTLDWINQFVSKAVEMEIDEIRLLEHCYRFEEFVPMYDSVCAYSEYVDAWFHRNAGVHKLADYLELIEQVRNEQFPVEIKFGLEICYFKEFESFISELPKVKALIFYWEAFILLIILLLTIKLGIGRGLMWIKYIADILRTLFHWLRAEYLTASVIRMR